LVDIPINHLFVTVKLPKDCEYSEFNGDLQEVQYFSSTPPTSGIGRVNDVQPMVQQQMVTNFMPQAKSITNSVRKRKMAVGVLPVKIQMPTGGKSFYFERLLVMEETFNVSVKYKRNIVQLNRIKAARFKFYSKLFFYIAIPTLFVASYYYYFFSSSIQ